MKRDVPDRRAVVRETARILADRSISACHRVVLRPLDARSSQLAIAVGAPLISVCVRPDAHPLGVDGRGAPRWRCAS
jgi:hypothetical protein